MRSPASPIALALLLSTLDASAEPRPNPAIAASTETSTESEGGRFREIVFDAGGGEAELQARDESGPRPTPWTTLCRAPCRARAPLSLAYSVAGPGAPRSKRFWLGWEQEPLSIHARPGSKAKKITGFVLVPVGGVVLLLGFAAAFPAGVDDAQRRLGYGLSLGGAAALTAGVLLIVTGRTKVKTEPASSGAAISLPLGRGVALSPAGLTF